MWFLLIVTGCFWPSGPKTSRSSSQVQWHWFTSISPQCRIPCKIAFQNLTVPSVATRRQVCSHRHRLASGLLSVTPVTPSSSAEFSQKSSKPLRSEVWEALLASPSLILVRDGRRHPPSSTRHFPSRVQVTSRPKGGKLATVRQEHKKNRAALIAELLQEERDFSLGGQREIFISQAV